MAPSIRGRCGFLKLGNLAMARQKAAAKSEVMPPAIWGQLPEHLLDRIFALLPLDVLISLRHTCRHFHSLFLSSSFLSQFYQQSPRAAYFLLSHPQFSHRCLLLYNTAVDSWFKLPITLTTSSCRLLSSSSGLLCFSLSHPSSSLLIYNILTFTSRIIPCPQKSASLVALVSSPSPFPHGYKIFLASSSCNTFSLYDSDSHAWTSFPLFEPLVSRTSSHRVPVFFSGILYFTTDEPFSIVGFDLDAKIWKAAVAPELPPELAFVRLVGSERGNKLFLVAGVGRDGISSSLKLWEMVPGELPRWEELGRLPDLMCRKFVTVCYHNYLHVSCMWHDGMICLWFATWPEVLFFKVGRRTWHWLPKCPMLEDNWNCGFRWFSFVPDSYAMV